MRKIAIEEHFWTENYLNFFIANDGYPRLEISEDEKGGEIPRMWHSPDAFSQYDPGTKLKLLDVKEGRLADMDRVGIDMQVLSIGGPGLESLETEPAIQLARTMNDDLYRIIESNPDRFAGFAAIATQAPEQAAEEFERAVKDLGFKGAKVLSHVKGEYLDDEKFWVIFEVAESLGAPIYLHPRVPPPDMVKPFMKYKELAGPMWGFAVDAGLHAMRLICSGVFDQFPGLKIILGHMGEALPFWMWRLDSRWHHEAAQSGYHDRPIKKTPSHYVKENFLITTSGMCYQPALLCACFALGADKILFAVDYPWESEDEAVKFMDAAPISDIDKERIYYLNAQEYLRL